MSTEARTLSAPTLVQPTLSGAVWSPSSACADVLHTATTRATTISHTDGTRISNVSICVASFGRGTASPCRRLVFALTAQQANMSSALWYKGP